MLGLKLNHVSKRSPRCQLMVLVATHGAILTHPESPIFLWILMPPLHAMPGHLQPYFPWIRELSLRYSHDIATWPWCRHSNVLQSCYDDVDFLWNIPISHSWEWHGLFCDKVCLYWPALRAGLLCCNFFGQPGSVSKFPPLFWVKLWVGWVGRGYTEISRYFPASWINWVTLVTKIKLLYSLRF